VIGQEPVGEPPRAAAKFENGTSMAKIRMSDKILHGRVFVKPLTVLPDAQPVVKGLRLAVRESPHRFTVTRLGSEKRSALVSYGVSFSVKREGRVRLGARFKAGVPAKRPEIGQRP